MFVLSDLLRFFCFGLVLSVILTLNPNVCKPCCSDVVLGDLQILVNTRSRFLDLISSFTLIYSFLLAND